MMKMSDIQRKLASVRVIDSIDTIIQKNEQIISSMDSIKVVNWLVGQVLRVKKFPPQNISKSLEIRFNTTKYK